jgi:hypothetical protein
MRTYLTLAACVVALPASVAFAQTTLTAAEKAAGWIVLFDGQSTDNFRAYKQDRFPEKGWKVEDGALRVIAGGGGGDIVTQGNWEDFELSLDFKCAPGANSGIMYRVDETLQYPWMTGPEFQILDDAKHKDGLTATHSVGALYDMIAPESKPEVKAGEWNNARIRIRNGVLTHYLNGQKVVETRIDDESWTSMIAKSKFKDMKGFGIQPKGHIALQDHGDDVWYRNIKVRDLSGKMPGQVDLFNGKDLAGWTPIIQDGAAAPAEPIWAVDGGVIKCSGTPAGYIKSEGKFTNFVLKFEWRWPANPGNSGALLRVQEPDKVWPKSIEAQVRHTSAGDFWIIDEFPIKTDDARKKGRRTDATHRNERPQGEWNEYEILVDGGNVVLKVNGEELNRATDAAELAGAIAFQSEGAPIEFRRIRVAPIASGGK